MHKIFGYSSVGKERKIGQKITLGVAFGCYICSVISAGIMILYGQESTATPVFASLLAITVFFACVGIVLHVLGSGSLPTLKLDEHPETETYHKDQEEVNDK